MAASLMSADAGAPKASGIPVRLTWREGIMRTEKIPVLGGPDIEVEVPDTREWTEERIFESGEELTAFLEAHLGR
jgi:hypothetical protein